MSAIAQAISAVSQSLTDTSIVTTGITTAAGSYAVAQITWVGANAGFTSITDSKNGSSGWVQIGTQQDGTVVSQRLYYNKLTLTGTAHTFTATLDGQNGYPSICVCEVTGLDADAFDQIGVNTGTSATPGSGATGTRTQANEITIGAAVVDIGTDHSWTTTTNGWTIPTNGQNGNGGSNAVFAMCSKNFTSTGTEGAEFTYGASAPWLCKAATFKDAQTGVTRTPDVCSLVLEGQTPTVIAPVLLTPSAVDLVLAGQQSIVSLFDPSAAPNTSRIHIRPTGFA